MVVQSVRVRVVVSQKEERILFAELSEVAPLRRLRYKNLPQSILEYLWERVLLQAEATSQHRKVVFFMSTVCVCYITVNQSQSVDFCPDPNTSQTRNLGYVYACSMLLSEQRLGLQQPFSAVVKTIVPQTSSMGKQKTTAELFTSYLQPVVSPSLCSLPYTLFTIELAPRISLIHCANTLR